MSQPGAGSSVSSRTATTMQAGMMTARWRSIVRPRQPASVSSCLTQSTFSAGSRKPAANRSQRATPGSPSTRAILSLSQLADDRAGGDRLADLDGKLADDAVLVRGERLLHLHRLEHDHRLACRDALALGRDDLDDRALHRADQRVAARAPGRPAGRGTPAAAAARGRRAACPGMTASPVDRASGAGT